MKRNSYLVDKAFRSFLLATVLATVASSLAISVDSLIVGNLLGPEPLAALSLVTPVAQIYNALAALVNVGGAMVASRFIGMQKQKSASAVCMTSLAASLTIGLIVALAGIFVLPSVSGLLTASETLRSYAEQYLRIMLISAPIYLLLPGLCVFIRTDSGARRASLALIVANVVNLVLDVVFIRVFNMGIAGSSLATTCGYVIGIVIAALHFKKDASALAVTKPDFSQLGAIVKAGAPVALASALTCVRLFMTNTMVQSFLGADKMPLMAVCFSLMMLASMFIGGVSQSFQPVGGILIGMGDMRGLRMVAKKAWTMLGVCLGALLAFALAAPGAWLSLFGLEATAEAQSAVRIFSLSLPLYGACYITMVTHQTLGRTGISLTNAVLDSFMVVVAIFVMASAVPELLWAGFAVGEALVLIIIAVATLFLRRKERSPFLLLPPVAADAADFSTRADMAELPEAMEAIAAFLRGHGRENSINHIQLCCEEMLAVTRPDAKDHAFADIRLHEEGGALTLCIVTAGRRIDMTEEKKESLSLSLCDAMCTQMKHSYIAGQNVTLFTFERL